MKLVFVRGIKTFDNNFGVDSNYLITPCTYTDTILHYAQNRLIISRGVMEQRMNNVNLDW